MIGWDAHAQRWVFRPRVPLYRRTNVKAARIVLVRRENIKRAREWARHADKLLTAKRRIPKPDPRDTEFSKLDRRHALLLLLAYLRGRPYASQERHTRVQWVPTPVPGMPYGSAQCVWHNRPSLTRLACMAAKLMGGEPMYYVDDLALWLGGLQ